MKKRIFAIVLSIVCLFSACGSAAESTPRAASSSVPSAPKPESVVVQEPEDPEIAHAIALGLVPKGLETKLDTVITFAEYCQMLSTVVEKRDPAMVAEWEKKAEKAFASTEPMLLDDAMIATYTAAKILGSFDFGSEFPGGPLYNTVLTVRVENQMQKRPPDFDKTLQYYYPEFPGWNTSDGGDRESWIMFGIAAFSNISGKQIFGFDDPEQFKNCAKPFTRADAIRAVLRFAESDPQILCGQKEYIPISEVGAYNKNIITDELLAKPSKLPTPTQAQMPSNWKGSGISARKDAEHKYVDFKERDIRFLAENGMNFTRVFFDFEKLAYPDYPEDTNLVNKYELEDLDQLLAWCIEYDVHMQITMVGALTGQFFQGVGYGDFTPEAWGSIISTWAMLAKRYEKIPSKYLSFDLINERTPVPADYAEWEKNFAEIRDAIWEITPDRVLLYSFPNVTTLEWAKRTAALGLAIGCHPYFPIGVCAGPILYLAPMHAQPQWPMVWFPSSKVNGDGAPIILTGEVSGGKLSLYYEDGDGNAVITVTADGNQVAEFKPSFKKGQPITDLYTAEIPEGTKEIRVRTIGGYAMLGTMTFEGAAGKTEMIPHDYNESPWVNMFDPLPLIINADGTYTNTENRMVDAEMVYEVCIKPFEDIAKANNVGIVLNETGLWPVKTRWNVELAVNYYNDILPMFERHGLSYCLGESEGGGFFRFLVAPFDDLDWKGSESVLYTYDYDDAPSENFYVNKTILDVFRKYTLK